jgi:peptide/nickel transport system substrate-binding protein
MSRRKTSGRGALLVLIVGLVLLALAAGPLAGLAQESQVGEHLIGKLEGPEIITDRVKFPKTFNEAPQLTELVKAGKLPPVEARIGDDPLVIKPLHEIGKYGGIIRRAFTGPADTSNGVRFAGNDSLVHWDWTGVKLVPLVAKSWETSEDGRVHIFHLRRGMKWSDGHPFTADDFVFWYEDIYLNENLSHSKSGYFVTKNGDGVLEKVDDHTIKVTFKDPYHMFPVVVTGPTGFGGQAHDATNPTGGGYAPAHYLKRFHPKYVGQETVDKIAADAGYDNWVNLFYFKRHWSLNPELPVLTPWKTITPINKATWKLERNPYFWAVDTAGNQLPYIDEVHLTMAEHLEILNLRAIAGDVDYQSRHLDLQKLPVFLANQEKGNYKVYLDPGGIGSDAPLHLNLSYKGDPVIAALLLNRDFRRALSLGIDRDELNETLWLGLGTPGSVAPTEQSPYNPGPEWRTKWSTYDPATANQMLDAIGLTEKDAEGYRLRPDGKGRLVLGFQTYVGFMSFTQMAEMIKEQWQKIGIFIHVTEMERGLFNTRIQGNEHQIAVGIMWGTENLFAHSPTTLFPFSNTSAVGPLYGAWFASGGTEGEEPPPRMREIMEAFTAAYGAPQEEHVKLGKKVWEIAIDEQYVIGTVGLSPAIMGLRIAKTNLGNIPQRMFNGSSTLHPRQSKPETFFWKK